MKKLPHQAVKNTKKLQIIHLFSPKPLQRTIKNHNCKWVPENLEHSLNTWKVWWKVLAMGTSDFTKTSTRSTLIRLNKMKASLNSHRRMIFSPLQVKLVLYSDLVISNSQLNHWKLQTIIVTCVLPHWSRQISSKTTSLRKTKKQCP